MVHLLEYYLVLVGLLQVLLLILRQSELVNLIKNLAKVSLMES